MRRDNVGPRALLPIDVGALVLALAGAGVLAPPIVAAYTLGALTGAVVALGLAWHALSPPMRGLVGGYVRGRLNRPPARRRVTR